MGAPDGELFVARERELASLRAALDRGLAGDSGLVLVVGEAGMGKTGSSPKDRPGRPSRRRGPDRFGAGAPQ